MPWAAANALAVYFSLDTWGWVVTAGGGLDIETPWLKHRLAFRLVQADYQYASVNFLAGDGGAGTFNIMRLSSGVVFHLNASPPKPVTLACSARPASVYPGDPVTVTATAGYLDPKMNAVYSWSGSGVTGSRNHGQCGHRFAGCRAPTR